IRNFYRDFDPAGTVNVEFTLAKVPGIGQVVKLIDGRMEAVDCGASYRMFPYRVSRLRGAVHYQPDGLRLDNLVGEHQGGKVTVNGTIAQPKWYSACSLDITGQNIPLDRALHDALGPRHRAVWDRFELDGQVDLAVSLVRDQGSPDQGEPWQTVVEADFLDLNASFLTFAYPVEHLKGHLRIDSEGFTVRDLAGQTGSGKVVFNGTAKLGRSGDKKLDLRLAAEEVGFDQRLYDALPPGARDAVQRFAPDGKVDLHGRLSLAADGGLVYDIQGDLRDVTLTYRELPIPVEKVSGRIHLTPQRVTLSGVEGRQGDTVVSVEGYADRSGDSPETRLTISCRGLRLSEELRDLVPAELGRLWDLVRIEGPVDTETLYVRTGRGQDVQAEQATRVTAHGIKLMYAGFPLELSEVDADAVIRGQTVEIESLKGSFGEGRILVRGSVSRGAQGPRGSLSVKAQDMAFSESLRQALPWRLRRTWNHLQPAGRFDLDEMQLVFEPDQEGRLNWDFAGRLDLDDAGFEAGVKVTGVSGSVFGSGQAGADSGGLAGQADLELSAMAIKGRSITDLTGKLIISAVDQRVRLSEL
ncbi:MAG: hypothetical protein ACE5GE_17240, partial [Phycisphaerae bacterium]